MVESASFSRVRLVDVEITWIQLEDQINERRHAGHEEIDCSEKRGLYPNFIFAFYILFKTIEIVTGGIRNVL
jgi:hypothetical protein